MKKNNTDNSNIVNKINHITNTSVDASINTITTDNTLNSSKRFKDIAFFIFLILFFTLFEIVYLPFGIDFNKISDKTYVLLMYIKYFVFIAIIIIRYRKYLVEKFKDFIKNRGKYIKTAFKWWALGFLIMFIANRILGTFISGEGANEETVQRLLSNEPLLMFISASVIAPFVEEFIYRKALGDCFRNKLLFIIISGLLFGLAHVISSSNPLELLYIISYGAFGACFAKILVDTDNIYATIMVHVFHNTVLSLISILLVIL